MCVSKNKSFLVPYVWKSTGQENETCLEHDHLGGNRVEAATKFESFDKMIESRRNQAQRSILVQVQSEQSCTELHAYCSQYGQVKGLHHYMLPESLHFILVEFSSAADVRSVMSVCGHAGRAQVVPVRSPFLWFRARDKTKPAVRRGSPAPLAETFGNAAVDDAALRQRLLHAGSFSAQLTTLHASTRLTDLGVRLRFLTARQAELALSGPFPRVRALPFGSTVNGFGRVGCDLDLVLALDDQRDEEAESSRLVFHAKGALANGRTQVQRHMEAVGDICQLFLPGCSQVRRILQARVPIVKYRQELTDVECDLSMTNMCAVHMSELLHLLGCLDGRVQPLVFAVRHWARRAGLTSLTPGRWITNFGLSLLVLFYLQQRGVLPSLDLLAAMAGPADRRVTSEGVNCTFLRDAASFHRQSLQPAVPDDLETLLLGFFEYFAAFDFAAKALSLNEGRPLAKPEHGALYIANPLERSLNVTKNVSAEEAERLRIELRTAAWSCESSRGDDAGLAGSQRAGGGEAWGLVAMLEDAGKAGKGTMRKVVERHSVSRLMEIKELFSVEEGGAVVVPRAGKSKAEGVARKANDFARVEQIFEQRVGGKGARNAKGRRKR